MHILYPTYAEDRHVRMRDATPVACGIALALILCVGLADILMYWQHSTPLSLCIYVLQLTVPCSTWWLARIMPQRIEALAVAACAIYVMLQCSDLSTCSPIAISPTIPSSSSAC